MLSWTKRRDLAEMEKRAENDSQMHHLQDSLDALAPLTGLWPTLQLDIFHWILSLRCPEVWRQNLLENLS